MEMTQPFLEITRLQNSLKHLEQTQDELREYNSAAPDPDFVQAIEENEVVMWVQLTVREWTR